MEKPQATLTANIHQEIAQIEHQLAQKKQELQQLHTQGEINELPHDKETLHSMMQEKINPDPSGSTTSDDDDDDTDDDQDDTADVTPPHDDEAPSYLQPALKDDVQSLVNTAFTKSIDSAISEVRGSNNPALIDAFHDALVDQLYDHLVERGKLKQV